MNFSRRTFLGSFAAAVAAPRFLRAETPLAKVGILSDTHVSVDPKTVEPLLKAFRRFAAEGVGTVVISGDVCEVGTLVELKCVMDAWHTAFPGGKNALGQKMVTGEEKMPGEVFIRKSHGLTFVGAHWKHQGELGAFLKEHAAEIPSALIRASCATASRSRSGRLGRRRAPRRAAQRRREVG